MAEKRYVTVRLLVEDIGVIDDNGPNTTRMYNLYDSSGILEGDLELVCTETQLDGELAKLSYAIPTYQALPPVQSHRRYDYSPSTLRDNNAPFAFSSVNRVKDKRIQIKHLDAPDNISAGGLLDAIATETGTQSVFTKFLVELIDDLLRPQK